MHLSSQEEYGLRCLVQVARHHGDEPLRVHEIADAEGISPEYVAKLMRVLRNGELVTSTRGAAGGYRLGREAEEITVWDVLHVLGGSLFSEGFCDAHPGTLRDCIHSSACSIRSLWRNLDSVLHALLSGVTIGALARGETAVDGTLAAASWRMPTTGADIAFNLNGAKESLPDVKANLPGVEATLPGLKEGLTAAKENNE